MKDRKSNKRFSLGKVFMTRGVMKRVPAIEALNAFTRHASCDWGDADKFDWEQNNLALKEGTRLLSVYAISNGLRLWIITERDRSMTTLLLPEEY